MIDGQIIVGAILGCVIGRALWDFGGHILAQIRGTSKSRFEVELGPDTEGAIVKVAIWRDGHDAQILEVVRADDEEMSDQIVSYAEEEDKPNGNS